MPAASGLELACWLAAAVLALALVLAPTPNTEAAAEANTAMAAPEAPNLVRFRQHCIERILVHAADKSEERVVELIKQLCIAPHPGNLSSATGLVLLSCNRPFGVALTPVAKRVAGCPGG